MSLSQILVLAVAANLDNIGVGVAYGSRKVGLCFYKNLLISLISFLFTLFCGYLGYCITQVLPFHWAKIIGANMLIGVGFWVVFSDCQRQSCRLRGWVLPPTPLSMLIRAKEAFLRTNSKLTWGETVVLGVALSINSMVGGFLAGIQGGNIILVSACIAVFSYLFILLGLHLGENYAAKVLGEKSGFLAGILLVAIGIYQLLI